MAELLHPSILEIFNTNDCIITIDFEKDTERYFVYVLDVENHWYLLGNYKELNRAINFAYRFFGCHSNYTRLSINYVKVF